MILAGRGFGKTRSGAEHIRSLVEDHGFSRIALIGPTASDVRDVMVEGDSGILAVSSPWFMPKYESSHRRVRWPNGAMAFMYSAEEPKRLRGPQHQAGWLDELCSWRYPRETWDMFQFGLRSGKHPHAVVTTTPKKIELLKEILTDPQTLVTGGSTYENRANVSEKFINRVIARYEGTELGRQELNAELIDDRAAALWKRSSMIEPHRVREFPDCYRIVVAVDPSVGDGESNTHAECGIVVLGIGANGHGYVLEDCSIHGHPHVWATAVVTAYHKYRADMVVAEVNNGGAMVEATIHTVDKNIPYTAVHATRGKYVRAEPVSSLYQQGRMHHVGFFALLEDQLCNWVPGEKSPDRLDALVWAATFLMLPDDDDTTRLPIPVTFLAGRQR